MKLVFKILAFLVLFVIVVVFGLLIYVKAALPDVSAAEDLKIEYTPERIKRGEYLANGLSACMDCHSKRDWSKLSGPIAPGTLGMGGERFDQTMGIPGVFYSKNITPAGISRYTDGELVRVITTGVTKEGRAMFPLMPYPYYGRMDREDIYSIVAYVRSLSPIENAVPESEPDFPMNFIINTIPHDAAFVERPDPADQIAYGGYLANAGGCVECHTPVKQGQIIAERSFGGGRDFAFPDGSVARSANITPDVKTGIGSWTEANFIARFKAYADSTYTVPDVRPGEFNTVMPWMMYKNIAEEDLAAIFAYLKTVPAIENKVEHFIPAGEQGSVSSLQ